MRTSARNHFAGEISAVKTGAVNDEITLRSDAGGDIVAIVTQGSAAALGLAVGKRAFALVKASSVMLMVDGDGSNVSTRNRIAGAVVSVQKGAVNAEVIVTSQRGAQIAAIVTNDSVERLGLAPGEPAVALFKASSVIVGADD